MLSWPGVAARRQFVRGRPSHQGAKSGTVVGSIMVQLGTQKVVSRCGCSTTLAKESILSRIL